MDLLMRIERVIPDLHGTIILSGVTGNSNQSLIAETIALRRFAMHLSLGGRIGVAPRYAWKLQDTDDHRGTARKNADKTNNK